MNWTRGITNVSYRRRVRQIVVVIFTIIMGILISQSTSALRSDVIESQQVIENMP
jgi:hypothetical protein